MLPVFPKYPVPPAPAPSPAPAPAPAPAPRSVRGGSRIPAEQINKAASDPKVRTQTVAAAGALLPIPYGRVNVPGLPFFWGSIGTDLVVGYIWGVGEIDAIEQVQINDLNGGSISGVTLTHYLGTTTQGVDATLVAANAGYADTLRFDVGNGLRGIAYTVARITSAAAVGGWPRARATIRGRKLYDPRTGTTVYSDNPALAMADLITDKDYGAGLTVLGLSAAADWCDTLLGGAAKRAQIALTLTEGRAIDPGWLDILSVYAECGYVHEGSSIRLIPDAPVDLGAAPTIDASLIIANSLRVQAVNDIDTPTEVEIIYTLPGSATTPWPNASNSYATPGGQRIPTSIRLEGVYRSAEAGNKAKARLARLKNRVSVSFQTTDSGIVRQAGDVVKIASPARGVTLPLRIESVAYAGPGRYNVSGLRYDPNHYPADLVLPSGYGTLPNAAILLFDAATLPAGYSDFTAANGKFIMGAGGTYAAGATGGSSATGAWSGTTTSNGAHTGSISFSAAQYGVEIGSGVKDVADTSADHSHSWSAAAVTMDLLRRRHRLAKRAGAYATIPASMLVFGIAGLSHPDVARITINAGRLVMADTITDNAGTSAQVLPATVASANMAHKHYDLWNGIQLYPNSSANIKTASPEMNWPHTHTLNPVLVASIKRRKLALYGGVTDYPVLAGMIVLYEGAVPAGWALCDGTLGTPDMRDFLLEIAATGQEGVSAGDNTVSFTSAPSGSFGHSHISGDAVDGPYAWAQLHSEGVYHVHFASASQSYTPPWYALKFIMCTP